ncbi:MAG: adenylate kinase family protein, partial [Acidimicrobiales bacterium]
PRTVPQAEALAELLGPKGLDVVVNLKVDTEVVLKRLAARRVCGVCNANYTASDQLKVTGICDNCGGEVVQREDDTEEAISRRLELYEGQTAPLIDWYEARGLLASIDAEGPPAEVTARIVAEVDRRKRKRPKTAGAAASGAVSD